MHQTQILQEIEVYIPRNFTSTGTLSILEASFRAKGSLTLSISLGINAGNSVAEILNLCILLWRIKFWATNGGGTEELAVSIVGQPDQTGLCVR